MTSDPPKTIDPLIRAAGLVLYRQNVFRITGLPVDATSREITKHADRLKLASVLGHGQAGGANACSLMPPPDGEQIKEAIQRLKEPEMRIIDEFFWFWPADQRGSANDPAIRALQEGRVNDACDAWRAMESDPEKEAIAAHNLAVFDHMVAIDWTLIQLADLTNLEAASHAEKHWQLAMDRWEHVATDDRVWDLLKERIREINDARLTTGFARRMEMALPEAMDKINAEAALKFAELGDIDAARLHIRIMNQTHQGLDDVEGTAELILMPLRRRVEQRIAHAMKAGKANAPAAMEVAQNLLNECTRMMPLFELFHGDTHHKTELFDEVAETAMQLGILCQKATDRNRGLVELLSHAMTCATADSLKSRIRENIRVIQGNLQFEKILPIIEAIKNINESDSPAVDRLAKMQKQVIPMAAPFAKESIGDMTVSDLVAAALRNISIDSYNNTDDVAAALKAICLAQDHVKDKVLKQQIAKDRGLVEERLQQNLCAHCGKQMGDSAHKHEFQMYGDVRPDHSMLEYGRILYRTGNIPVPRCSACGKKHQRIRSEATITSSVIAVVMLFLGLFMMSISDGIGFWVILIGLGIATICRVAMIDPYNKAILIARSHPNVREMKSKGWQFGAAPPQN